LSDDERVLIIGGGIGGLAAANALQRVGIECTVFERAPALTEIGAALGVQTSAVKALRRLGRADEVIETGVEVERYEGRALGRDQLLIYWPQGEISRKLGEPTLVIHRVELLDILKAGIEGDIVNLNTNFVGYDEDDSGVTARFEDGREERGAFLIGADGIRSTVRRQLLAEPKLPIRYAGFIVWRGVTKFESPLFPPGIMRQYVGRGRIFGTWHVSHGRTFWIASAVMPEGGSDAPGGRKHEIMDWYDKAQDPIKPLIEATPEDTILRNDTIDLEPVPRWSSRRVTLLGDSAHACIQVTGQGAGQAIEDAAVLAKRLDEASTLKASDKVQAALQSYEANRIPRTTTITKEAWNIGKMLHWKNPVACFIRDQVLYRARPKSAWVKQMETRLGSYEE
jgi:2-polyprenyl-6-methoxyphenol hydroxylase-like FAD-dependent oxidoreductase